MFKRKLQKWGVAKYATSDKMDRVVESLQRTNERELTQPCPDKEMVVEGQKVMLSQVKRYMRRKRNSVVSHGDTNGEFMKRRDGKSNPVLRSGHFGQLDDSYAATGLRSEKTQGNSAATESLFANHRDFDCEWNPVSASDDELTLFLQIGQRQRQ
jgi:hypothetical protein